VKEVRSSFRELFGRDPDDSETEELLACSLDGWFDVRDAAAKARMR
jgi:hypothetical protein